MEPALVKKKTDHGGLPVNSLGHQSMSSPSLFFCPFTVGVQYFLSPTSQRPTDGQRIEGQIVRSPEVPRIPQHLPFFFLCLFLPYLGSGGGTVTETGQRTEYFPFAPMRIRKSTEHRQ